jgi:hypothetical protein
MPKIPTPGTEKKENVNNLRTIIKVDQPKTATEPPKKQEPAPVKEPPRKDQPASGKPDPAAILSEKAPGMDGAREDLEQRRMILQNLKDFDFQLKKNQEDVTHINEKVEGLSKDLDDLVSLYEIVSEQMNPFVGLSKVTKKRLDALENITTEVDTMKTKLKDMEAVFEKGGISLPTTPSKDTKPATLEPPPTTTAPPVTTTPAPPTPPQTAPTPDNKPTSQAPPGTPPPYTPELTPTPPMPTTIPQITPTPTAFQPIQNQPPLPSLSDTDLDILLTKALESFIIDQQIDTIMNDFIHNLK